MGPKVPILNRLLSEAYVDFSRPRLDFAQLRWRARSRISRASLSDFQQAYPHAAAMKLGIVCRVNMWRFRGSESQSRNRCTSWKVDHFGRASSEPSSEVIKGVHLRWRFAAYLGMHDRTDFHVAPNLARRRVAGDYGTHFVR